MLGFYAFYHYVNSYKLHFLYQHPIFYALWIYKLKTVTVNSFFLQLKHPKFTEHEIRNCAAENSNQIR